MPKDMNFPRIADVRAEYECIALLLQGGGALGAYQAGVYSALAEAGIEPDWVAGISIGAINSAIIAGNEPRDRVAKLRAFWEMITEPATPWFPARLPVGWIPDWLEGDDLRRLKTQASALAALRFGAPGFFSPRPLLPMLMPSGTEAAVSYYDTSALQSTLEQLVDFDRINHGATRLSVGAVNVRSGNFVYFDSEDRTIRPEHVMASGALPPGFPAVEIDGQHYWDGGLVSNTPLDWVVGSDRRQDTLAFQVDLWSARGDLPKDMPGVAVRQKEIQFSSRTRATTDNFRRFQQIRGAIGRVLDSLPADGREGQDYRLLKGLADEKVYSVIELIYHAQNHEGDSKDYEFSRESMEAHWRSGIEDARRTLAHPDALIRPAKEQGVRTFDIASA